MKLLLDTHAILWFTQDSPEMPEALKAQIESANCTTFVSIASIWEIAIKVSLGKLQLSAPIDTFVPALFQRNGFRLLPIQIEHTLKVATLPYHHKDPFDRILIAQSLVEATQIASADVLFDSYGVDRHW